MSYQKNFLTLLTNEEYQNILLNNIPYQENHIFEPYEVLYKLINHNHLQGLQNDNIWSQPLKDNQKAIDCISIENNTYTAIQIKHKNKTQNEDMLIDYMKGEIQRRPDLYPQKEYQYKIELYSDEKYKALLSVFQQKYLKKFSIQLRPYQQTFIDEHKLGLLNSHISVVNCFCRFGKSYLMKYLQELFNWHTCVITTKPTETGEQFKALNMDFMSIQYLKINQQTPNKNIDCLFIDEAQEQFMTELTEGLINLNDYKHVIFFTGTSESLLEYLYFQHPYYCHYNFGDYLIQPIKEFQYPSIQFIYDKKPQYVNDNYIHLIFNRNLNTQQALQMAAENGWNVQTSKNESDIKTSNGGVYLCIEQYTTGVTLNNCVSVEIQNTQFTETDIQALFRCWNPCLLDVPRKVYFSNLDVMQKTLEYIFRQTGEQYISSDRVKQLFNGLISDADLSKMTFKQLEINISKGVINALKNKLLHIDTTTKRTFEKALIDLNKLVAKEKLTENELFIQKSIKEFTETGIINDTFIVLIQRIICQLAFETINYEAIENPINRDYSTVDLFKKLNKQKTELLALKGLLDTFNTSRQESAPDTYKKQLFLIFNVYDKAVNSRIVKYIRQLIQHSMPQERYTLLGPYFQTTQLERKKNAEILTPDWVVEEMLDKLESIYGIDQITTWKIIEPCCGKGAFLIGLYKRLYKYYQQKGLQDIHQKILSNLYWNDFNQSNTEFCNILMNSNKADSMNRDLKEPKLGTSKDALQENYQNYDLVITNPPYNSERGKDNVQHQIYQNFVLKFLEAKYSSLIIKSNWCLDQRKLFKDFRNKFVQKCVLINSFDEKQTKNIFNNTSIKGGVLYYIAERDKINSIVNINQEKIYYKQNQQVFIMGQINSVQKSILDQFQYLSKGYFLKLSYQDKFENIKTNDNILCHESLKHLTKTQEGVIQKRYIPKSLLEHPPFENKYIVATPTAATGGGEGLIRCLIIPPGEIFSQSYIGFVCNNYQQAVLLSQYLLSQEVQDIIKKVKQTQSVSKQIFEHIPQINILNQFQYLSQGYFLKLSYQDKFENTKTNDNILCHESLKHLTKTQEGVIQKRYIPKSLLEHPPFIDKYIVATPSAATGGGEGLTRCIIIPPGEVFSKSYIGFVCNNQSQAVLLSQYLLSQEVQDIIKKVKQTQSVSKQIFEHIPFCDNI